MKPEVNGYAFGVVTDEKSLEVHATELQQKQKLLASVDYALQGTTDLSRLSG